MSKWNKTQGILLSVLFVVTLITGVAIKFPSLNLIVEKIALFWVEILFVTFAIITILCLILKMIERKGKEKEKDLLKELRKAYDTGKNFAKQKKQQKKIASLVETIENMNEEEISLLFQDFQDDDVMLLGNLGIDALMNFMGKLHESQLLRFIEVYFTRTKQKGGHMN